MQRPERDKSGKEIVISVSTDPVSQLGLERDHSVDFTLSTNKKNVQFSSALCNVITQHAPMPRFTLAGTRRLSVFRSLRVKTKTTILQLPLLVLLSRYLLLLKIFILILL